MTTVNSQNQEQDEIWGNIRVMCPICNTSKKIDIPLRIINTSGNLTGILIPQFKVCEHAFIASVDKNLAVRGYQKIAFITEEENDIEDIKERVNAQDVDTFAIKMNIEPGLICSAIYSVFRKKSNIIIIVDDNLEYLIGEIKNFFEFIFQKSFEIKINAVFRSYYKKNKDNYNDALILESKNKKFDFDKMNYEGEIVKNFFVEGESTSSIINLRDHMRETKALIEKIKEFYIREGKENRLGPKEIIHFLEETQFRRIKKEEFEALLDITRKYFKIEIELTPDLISRKISEMWRE